MDMETCTFQAEAEETSSAEVQNNSPKASVEFSPNHQQTKRLTQTIDSDSEEDDTTKLLQKNSYERPAINDSGCTSQMDTDEVMPVEAQNNSSKTSVESSLNHQQKRRLNQTIDSDSEEEEDNAAKLLQKSTVRNPIINESSCVSQAEADVIAPPEVQNNFPKTPVESTANHQPRRRLKQTIISDSEEEEDIAAKLLQKSTVRNSIINDSSCVSQAEADEIAPPEVQNNSPKTSVESTANHQQRRRLKQTIISDSEEEEDNTAKLLQKGDGNSCKSPVINGSGCISQAEAEAKDTVQTNLPETSVESSPSHQQTRRLKQIFDSDSEEEDNAVKLLQKRPVINDSESDEDEGASARNSQKKSVMPESESNSLMSRLMDLADPESSDEDDHHNNTVEETKPKKSTKIEKPIKKMTGKEAMEQMREIRADSQRRAREQRVSLPYHKPKARTLQEFLQNRPRFAEAIPNRTTRTPPSLAIKMSIEQLQAISKKIQEREKAVKEFFKSESESEDEPEEPVQTNETEAANENPTIETEAPPISEANKEQDALEISENQLAVETRNENQLVTETIENEATAEINAERIDSETKENQVVTETIAEQFAAEANEKVLTEENRQSKNTMDYEFDLDGENIDSQPAEDEQQKQLNVLIEKYAGDDDAQVQIKSKIKSLKEGLGAFKPQLSGNPNDVIDFSDGSTKPDEIAHLMERFMQHAVRKNHHKTKVHVDVINMVDGEIHKETLSVPLDAEEEEPITEKPGLKLRKLRDELETQMALRRSERWQQKARQVCKSPVADCEPEKSSVDDDAVLDDEEEEEFTDSESEDAEEELDLEVESSRKKFAFVDDEAEDSEQEELLVKHDADATVDDDADATVDDDADATVDDDADDESEDTQGEVQTKRKLRRILQPFADDSDDELDKHLSDASTQPPQQQQQPPQQQQQQPPQQQQQPPPPKNAVDDSTDTWDDSGPPPNQPATTNDTFNKDLTQTKSQLGFLSPVIHLTGLQSFNSGSKFLRDSPVTPFNLNVPPSPITASKSLQKKLFQEPPPIEPSQVESEPSTQDLLEICSGSFSPKDDDASHPIVVARALPEIVEESEPLPEVIDDVVIEEGVGRIDDNDEKLISQLLDEEELENFKKKFESPVPPPKQTAPPTSPKIDRFVFDSSDEETNNGQRRAKPKAKLIFSDDEEEESDSDSDVENKVVEYDSEENEIVKDDTQTAAYKITDFVEKEAELSESEWGSADEDENDLDELEFELGDAEAFDENQIRSDLERIHMRRLLDDDNRNVKILQELLLEDGELHGSGRQRQFRWKNIDTVDGDVESVKVNEPMNADDNVDDENEEEWRKLRYQRELYLKKVQAETQKYEDDVTLSCESQVLKLGRAALKRSTSQTTNSSSEKSLEFKQLLSKRGSFLTRSDEVLTKLADYAKVTTNAGVTVKNSRKFVFQSVSVTEEKTISKKRKPTDATPTAIKKLRLTDFSPASQRRPERGDRVKKLFSNW